MIFVTVGTQAPFDRLVRTVDGWAGRGGGSRVFAQVGDSDLEPRNIEWVKDLTPAQFRERLAEAEAIVSHAGMGTILTAREFGKPIVILPRRAELGEQRNDHQLATARHLVEMGIVTAAGDEADLCRVLDSLGELPPAEKTEPVASPELLDAVRSFLSGS